MNRLEKIAIFLVSVMATLVGFDLIAAPAVAILKIGRLAGYQIIANYLAKTGTTGLSSPYSMYLKLPIGGLLILAICAIVLFIVVKMRSFGKKTRKPPRQKPDDRRPRLGQFQTPDPRMDF
jgi:hypothetical protein